MIEANQNNQAVIFGLAESPERAEIGARRGFHANGIKMVGHNRRLIRKGPKTGKLYRIPGRKRKHRASAAGEPPANLSGALARSIGYEIFGNNEMAFGSRSDSDSKGGVAYGGWLDGGTKDGRIKPRPHVSRTVDKFDDEFGVTMDDEIFKML